MRHRGPLFWNTFLNSETKSLTSLDVSKNTVKNNFFLILLYLKFIILTTLPLYCNTYIKVYIFYFIISNISSI